MEVLQYYSEIDPYVGELVLVHFTEHKDSFINAKLLEYPYNGMMNYQDATKKRRVLSWNKIIPLNKNMVARVEDVDKTAKIVQLSIAYLEESSKETNPDKIQENLLVNFTENKIMEGFIKSLCIMYDYSYNNVWTKLIHYIDSLRREYNEENDMNLSLWKYFCENITELKEWVESSGLDNCMINEIKDLYEKRTEKPNYKITSRVGIISLGGVSFTKELIKNVLAKLSLNYDVKYDTSPYYILETFSEDTDEEDHKNFIKTLEIESQKMNPKVFTKVDYIGKCLTT